ncbi:hypothetical protein C8R48DRAFT_677439 [Suillus tomentosus]|nr:hypothetical protein C8R48DRAFT_677439 [Suillus tomentosus]
MEGVAQRGAGNFRGGIYPQDSRFPWLISRFFQLIDARVLSTTRLHQRSQPPVSDAAAASVCYMVLETRASYHPLMASQRSIILLVVPIVGKSFLFDDAASRINIIRISNSLGIELLDAYIGLLQTELQVLSFLCKNRVYPGDLWEIVGERIIEAKQESILRQHQIICADNGFTNTRHIVVEHLLMEERRKRGQMEVSLYSQALEYLQQHCMLKHSAYPVKRDVRSSATSSHPVDRRNLSCSTATQEKCEAWLKRRYTYPLQDAEPLMGNCSFMGGIACSVPGFSSAPGFATMHEAKRKSDISNCIGPLLPLVNSLVTVDVQQAFYDALCTEQACQAGLVARPLTVNLYQRNIELEMLILRAKMRRAKAEIELYTVAIQNARELDFSDNTSVSSSASEFIPPPRPDELCFYDEDRDDVTDDFDDFEF